MDAATVVRTIGLIIAPVVMISSCALIVNGWLARYESISNRMRVMSQERLGLLRTPEGTLSRVHAESTTSTTERLFEIDAQLPKLLRRHELLHNAVLTGYTAILVFVASMVVIAASAETNSVRTAIAALLLFLAGTLVLLLSVLIATIEVRRSHREVSYEVHRVLNLGEE